MLGQECALAEPGAERAAGLQNCLVVVGSGGQCQGRGTAVLLGVRVTSR